MAALTALILLPALAGAPAEPAAPDADLSRRAAERWAKHFVPVELWLKRSEGQEPSRFSNIRSLTGRTLRGGGAVEGQYDEKRPVELAGLAVDDRSIWIPDLGIERRFIARVAAGNPPAPAKLQAAFLRAPGWQVRPAEPLAGIEPLKFAAADSGAEGLSYLGASFTQGGWAMVTSGLGGEYRILGKARWIEAPRGVLLFNRDLEAVGYSMSGRLGLENAPDAWRGADLATGPWLGFEAFERAREALEKKLAPWALTVRGFFRREEEMEGRRRFHFRGDGDENSRNDFLTSGYAVGPHTVLVNHGLTRESAMRLERVVVLAGGQERPARFRGAFRRYEAFLIEVEGTALPEPLDLGSYARFEVSEPLISLTADHSSGRRRDLFDLNRVADFERGYRNFLEPLLQRFPRPGTILIGAEDQALRGAVVEVRRDSEDDERAFRARAMGGIDLRVLTPADLRRLLEEGQAAFDPRLAPRAAEREKDLVWLGVEFQSISRELAKSQGVEIPTRGGEIGLLVLEVIPGSPAAEAGFARGDILLSLREEEESEPIEIQAGRGELFREDPFEGFGEDELPEELLGRMPPPWRSPRNFLNERLTRIGEGQKVELVYLRGAMEQRKWVTLKAAPPDFENAAKHKSEDLGLTVKDLTYEVRSFYRLKDDAPGVVVAKVEPGEKAAIAKVTPFEILVSINGKVVRNVEDFRKTLEASAEKEAPGKVLELKLEKMGKSRLVRIR